MALLPPPAGNYASREELRESLDNWTAGQGYAITTKQSDLKRGRVKYQCNRGGKYNNPHHLTDDNRIRNMGTQRRECPFPAITKVKNNIWSFSVRRCTDSTP
jgi:hypothetical protein